MVGHTEVNWLRKEISKPGSVHGDIVVLEQKKRSRIGDNKLGNVGVFLFLAYIYLNTSSFNDNH